MKKDSAEHLAWTKLIGQFDVSSLIPASYARYAALINEGLAFFLEHLPEHRRDQILALQIDLPATSHIAQRVVVLMHTCPTLHKLGQILARDRRLAADFRSKLQTLESMEPRTPMSEVREVIRRELGESALRELSLSDEALAEASVAVVVPFEFEDSAGVLKVLKPGIEQQLEEELDVWQQMGAFMDQRSEQLDLPHLDYEDTLIRLRELLSCEVHLSHEQRHLAEAAEIYRENEQIHVPMLLPGCTPRITAMERLAGAKVTEAHNERRRLAELIVEAVVAHPIFAPEADALFHGDPHAGNLIRTTDGRLGILDWSLAGHLGKRRREQVVQVIVGGLLLDGARIRRALEDLALSANSPTELDVVVQDALRQIRWGTAPGMTWLIQLLDDAVQHGQVRFDADLMMFRKVILTIEGVVADVDPTCRADDVLTAAGLRAFCDSGTERLSSLPNSRSGCTHLSNLDLLEAISCGPQVAWRLWSGLLTDWSQMWSPRKR